MAKDEIQYYKDAEAEKVRKTIMDGLSFGRKFWRPLHRRMDYWATMYRMLDAIQQSKPLGVRRFISNDPRTAIDAGVSILTRNEIGWKIDLLGGEDENNEEVRKISKIERTLVGLGFDLDELMSMRYLPSWRVQQAQQALIRGAIWGKVHVTTDALEYRNSPILGEIYDARTVFPNFDNYGLREVLIEKLTNLGDLLSLYYDKFKAYEKQDPNTPVTKIEYWSNDRPGRKGITACLAIIGAVGAVAAELSSLTLDPQTSPSHRAEWLIEPYEHGLPSDGLPVVGQAVNGLAMRAMPALDAVLMQRMVERNTLLPGMSQHEWQSGPNAWVAETCRSMLSSVEDHVLQYNELIATIFQHLSGGTYGTWVFRNQTGELPDWHPGIESRIALKPDEEVNRITMEPITPDAYRLVQILQQEKERGALSSILQAVTPQNFNSAVLFQQIANAALNTLEPFRQGMVDFNTRMGTSVLRQMQLASPKLKKFELTTATPRRSFFRIEFDPKVDLDQSRHYRPVPVMKPALPDDLSIRMTAARQALDPRRPILSLRTVLENILQVDDVGGEIDRMWEDMAEMEPLIVLEQIAQALERRGEPEMAARIRDDEFRQAYIRDKQFQAMTGGGIGQGQGQMQGGGGMGNQQNAMTPEQTSAAPDNAGRPSAGEGAAVLGAAFGESTEV